MSSEETAPIVPHNMVNSSELNSFSTSKTLLLLSFLILFVWSCLEKSSLLLLGLGCAFGYLVRINATQNERNEKLASFQQKVDEIVGSNQFQPSKKVFSTELAINPNIDASLNKLFDLIMRDFVHLYYDPINPNNDTEFTDQVRKSLNSMAMNFALYCQKLDKVDLGIMFGFAVSNTFIVHLREYRKFVSTHQNLDMYCQLNVTSPFAHTTNKKEQAQTLRGLSRFMFSRLLPHNEAGSGILMAFFSEMWANEVFQKTLDTICDPDWINCTIVGYLTEGNNSVEENDSSLFQQLASSIDEEVAGLAEKLKEPSEDSGSSPSSSNRASISSNHDAEFLDSPTDTISSSISNKNTDANENFSIESSFERSPTISTPQKKLAINVIDSSPTPPLSPNRVFLRSDKSAQLQKILQRQNEIFAEIFAEFMAFLEELGSANLLRFWLQADSFRKIASNEVNPDLIQEDALRIFKSYFDETATSQIKIVPEGLVRRCIQEIEEAPTGNCFITVQEYIFGILERDYYDDFIQAMQTQGQDLSLIEVKDEKKNSFSRVKNEIKNNFKRVMSLPLSNSNNQSLTSSPLSITVSNTPSPPDIASESSLSEKSSPDTSTSFSLSTSHISEGEERHHKRSNTIDNSSLTPNPTKTEFPPDVLDIPEPNDNPKRRSRSLSTGNASQNVGKILENGNLREGQKIKDLERLQNDEIKMMEREHSFDSLHGPQKDEEYEEQDSSLSGDEEDDDLITEKELDLMMDLEGVQIKMSDVSESSPNKYIYTTKSLAYMIEVEQPGSTGWIMTRSFNDFEKLHTKLSEEFPKMEKVSMPRLRLKKNHEACSALERYLNILLSDRVLCKSKPLQTFMKRDGMPKEMNSANTKSVRKNSLWNTKKFSIKSSSVINLSTTIGNILQKNSLDTSSPDLTSLDITPENSTKLSRKRANNSMRVRTSIESVTWGSSTTVTPTSNFDNNSVTTTPIACKPATDMSIINSKDGMIDEQSLLSSEIDHPKRHSKPNKQLTGQDIDLLIDTMFAVVEEIFDLSEKSQWHLRKTVLSVLREVVRRSFSQVIKQSFLEAIESSFTEEQAVNAINQLTNSFWPNGIWADPAPARSEQEKLQTKEEAKKLLLKLVPDSLKQVMGSENSRIMVDGLVDGFLAEKEVVRGMGVSILESITKLIITE
ncbi:14634_t:CDS:2 [Ambispora leptoticha]|uniref:14634_t:CDS:1 n=1 Tax=Ambispora leptoticha TaxID=144679 RepID=A0A9N8YT36_9GLOM|nr:14634_t:CDS:2 [Ambispora leptoticha]